MRFSGEKSFCLERPYGFTYCWLDPNLEYFYFSKRSRGGDGGVVWTRVRVLGSTLNVFVKGKMETIEYSNMIGDVFMHLIEKHTYQRTEMSFSSKRKLLGTLQRLQRACLYLKDLMLSYACKIILS